MDILTQYFFQTFNCKQILCSIFILIYTELHTYNTKLNHQSNTFYPSTHNNHGNTFAMSSPIIKIKYYPKPKLQYFTLLSTNSAIINTTWKLYWTWLLFQAWKSQQKILTDDLKGPQLPLCIVLSSIKNNYPITLKLDILQPFLTSTAYIFIQNLCMYNNQLTHQYIYSQTSIWQHLKPGPIMVFLIHQKSADPLWHLTSILRAC